MGLFSKLKDYNLELEEVLDSKYFSSNIKSLLLSMIYKIEISYDDYIMVKRCVRSKEDFFNELIEVIRLYCDNVKVVEPDSDQAKILTKHKLRAITNEKERTILTYPTEVDLLYALSDISPKYFYISEDFAIKELIQNSLVNGYNINNVEILKDFNGWSWDTSHDSDFNYVDNLIYNNLLMFQGEKFLYEWRTYGSTRKNYLENMRKYIKLYTSNDNYYKYLLKTIYSFADEKDKEKVDSKIKEDSKLLKKMSNKIQFLEEAKNKKLKLTKRLEKIDIALNDKKVLNKELEKTNSKRDEAKQIKTLGKYKQIVLKERENILRELNSISDILKPSNFVQKKHILEESLSFLDYKEEGLELLINFQKEFLHIIEKKISKMQTREEVVDIIYMMRYYSRLQLDKDTIVSDIEELSDKIDAILKRAITILCKNGVLKIVSMNINLNFEIIKYAIDTKIINLEDIKLSFIKEKNGIIIQVYDKDVFEKQGRKKTEINNKTLIVRENRKIKLFN